jgi:undecaprenyl pyrophosphate synthase
MATGGTPGATRSRRSRDITWASRPLLGCVCFSQLLCALDRQTDRDPQVLEVCYKCGVKVVTVYAFSLENFHRPKYEVDGLMQLAKHKLEQLIQHGELLDRYGAGVKVLGRLDLIPPDVLEVVERAAAATQHNTE